MRWLLPLTPRKGRISTKKMKSQSKKTKKKQRKRKTKEKWSHDLSHEKMSREGRDEKEIGRDVEDKVCENNMLY